MPPLVQCSDAVTLVGGGALTQRDLRLALARAPIPVAADSGADALLAAGVMPHAVFGDFDSIRAETLQAIPKERIHPTPDESLTDFAKSLAAIEAPLILAVGFTGARMDHGLAVMNALITQSHRRCIVIGPKDIAFAAPPQISLKMRIGDAFSLFPLARVQAASTGLHWPLQGLNFAPDGMIGTSNRVSAPEVSLSFDQPGMLVILPRNRLSAAIKSLPAAPDWSAPYAPAARDK